MYLIEKISGFLFEAEMRLAVFMTQYVCCDLCQGAAAVWRELACLLVLGWLLLSKPGSQVDPVFWDSQE